jgi:hypothetical protein
MFKFLEERAIKKAQKERVRFVKDAVYFDYMNYVLPGSLQGTDFTFSSREELMSFVKLLCKETGITDIELHQY